MAKTSKALYRFGHTLCEMKGMYAAIIGKSEDNLGLSDPVYRALTDAMIEVWDESDRRLKKEEEDAALQGDDQGD